MFPTCPDATVRHRRFVVAADWTEGSVHVAGRLGATLLTALLDRQRLERRPGDRALAITDKGGHLFAELGIPCDAKPLGHGVALT
jgi:hypothetical protein